MSTIAPHKGTPNSEKGNQGPRPERFKKEGGGPAKETKKNFKWEVLQGVPDKKRCTRRWFAHRLRE